MHWLVGKLIPGIIVLALLLISQPASATPVDVMVGDRDFNDGDTLSLMTFEDADAGDPAPFNRFHGFDVSGPSGSTNWNFTYDAPDGQILSAHLTLGIFDHDSQAPGDQVELLRLDEFVLTATLNSALEASGGGPSGALGEYNIYTIELPSGSFSKLSEGGTFAATLRLQGPGLRVEGDSDHNGFGLDFARLELQVVPEPGTGLLLSFGLVILATRQKQRNRS